MKMLDEDYSCESCIKEAIARRFLFYPNHQSARVTQIPSDNNENCSICGGRGVKYSVSIILGSMDMKKVLKEREQMMEANRNAKKNGGKQ
jgi:hypothetical protein